MNKSSEKNACNTAAHISGRFSSKVIPMHKSEFAVELRFSVPLHMIAAARQALAPFMVEELTADESPKRSTPVSDANRLTTQEMKLLLRG